MSKTIASVSVNKNLEIEVFNSTSESECNWAVVRLSRVQAQRVARALLQYAGAGDTDPLLGKSMMATGFYVAVSRGANSQGPVYLDNEPRNAPTPKTLHRGMTNYVKKVM